MDIGTRLRNLREGLDMTLEEVASQIGVAKQTLYKYEVGIITNIPLANIEKLARIYKVTPNIITGWEDEPPVETGPEVVEKFPDDIVILARGAKTLTKDQIDLVRNMIDQLNKGNDD